MKVKLLYRIVLCMVICSNIFGSCSKDDSSSEIEDIQYTPMVMTPAMDNMVSGGNMFSYRVLQYMAAHSRKSCMVSPLSLSIDLGIILQSSDYSEARDKVLNMLGFGSVTGEEIREYCSTMLDKLPGQSLTTKIQIPCLLVANSEIGEVNNDFQNNLTFSSSIRVESLPFNDRQGLAKVISKWAKEKSGGRILSSVENINGDIVLANAFIMDGPWMFPFEKKNTSIESFRRDNNETTRLLMMKKNVRSLYAENELCKALILLFGNGAFVMNIFLPASNHDVSDVASYLADGGNPLAKANNHDVDVWLPKFTLSGQNDLRNTLETLSSGAINDCLLNVFDNGKTRVNNFFQMYFFSIDERGTNAKDIRMSDGVYPGPEEEFHADHPFIYTISETSTGAVLFAGVFRGDSD